MLEETRLSYLYKQESQTPVRESGHTHASASPSKATFLPGCRSRRRGSSSLQCLCPADSDDRKKRAFWFIDEERELRSVEGGERS